MMHTTKDDETVGADDPLRAAVFGSGRSTAVLLFDSGWISRRTDAVELLSDTWVRVNTTVDVAIPLSLDPVSGARHGGDPQFAVPVMLLPKVRPNLMRFVFRCGDEPLTIPTRHQNSLASYAALLWASASALDRWPLPDTLRRELMFVAIGAPEYAAPVSWHLRAPSHGVPILPDLQELPTLHDADAALVRWHQQLAGAPPEDHRPSASGEVPAEELIALHNVLAQDELASWLLRKLSTSAPLLAHTRRTASGRQTVRLAYDANLFKSKTADVGKGMVGRNGWLAYLYVIHTPYVGAASYHFEFIAPPGVEAIHSELLEHRPEDDEWDPQHPTPAAPTPVKNGDEDDDYETGRPRYDYVPIRGERVHLYRVDKQAADALSAKLYLRASRTGFIQGAWPAACAIALILVACAVLTRPLVSHGTGAQTLLLLLPGLLAALVARAGGHALVIRMLQGARRTLLVSGGLAFIGAGMLTLINTGDGAHAAPWQRWVFIVLAIAAVWQALKLLLARKLPRRPEPQGFLELQVDKSRRRAERRAERRARRRQGCLMLRVTSDALTWHAAEKLATLNGDHTRLPLALGPRQTLLQRQAPAVRIQPDAARGSLLRPMARPSDRYAAQELGMARRLAETIRWLGEQLPAGFRLEIRWAPLSLESRRALRYLRENWRDLLAGRPAEQWKPRARRPRLVEEVAAAARRGGLRMNCIHVIVPRCEPTEDEPTEGSGASPSAGD